MLLAAVLALTTHKVHELHPQRLHHLLWTYHSLLRLSHTIKAILQPYARETSSYNAPERRDTLFRFSKISLHAFSVTLSVSVPYLCLTTTFQSITKVGYHACNRFG